MSDSEEDSTNPTDSVPLSSTSPPPLGNFDPEKRLSNLYKYELNEKVLCLQQRLYEAEVSDPQQII